MDDHTFNDFNARRILNRTFGNPSITDQDVLRAISYAFCAINERAQLRAHLERIREAHGCTKAPTVELDVGAIIETHLFVLGRNALLEEREKFRDRRLSKLVQLVEHWETSVPTGDSVDVIMEAWARRVQDLVEVIGMRG